MKYLLFVLCGLASITMANAQKDIGDIRVYNVWSSFDNDSGTWGDWRPNHEVFILNYKDTPNIARCRIDNKIVLLKPNAEYQIKDGRTPSGYAYTEIKVTGEFYVPYTLKFFEDNPDYGLELSTGRVKLRFAKK